MLDKIVTNYVDAALAQLSRQNRMHTPGKLPDKMLDSAIPSSGDWIGWRAIDSVVTDDDLNALEKEVGLGYPPLYRDFLKYKHFVALTEVGVRFEPHLCHEWQEKLRSACFRSWPREKILDVGLLPFGSEAFLDAGPVCFDTRYRQADGDCPVVFWDHEWEGAEKEIQLMFSSSRKMFECLLLMASTDINFFYHYPGDDASLLPCKQALLLHFLSIDPEGAGGPGKNYWTGSGILAMG